MCVYWPGLDPNPLARRFRLPDHGRSPSTDYGSRRRTAATATSHFEPRPHALSPKNRARRIPTRLNVRSNRAGLDPTPSRDGAGPRSPLPDHGARERTTEPATDRGASDIPPRVPATP